MLAVHFALVTVQERHGKDVVSNGSGYELAQHLRKKRDKTLLQQDPAAHGSVGQRVGQYDNMFLKVSVKGDAASSLHRCSTNSRGQRCVAATAPYTAVVGLPVAPPACPIWGPAALWASCRRRGPCHSVTASFRTDQTADERSALGGWPCPPGPGTRPGRRTRTCVDPGLAPSAAAVRSQQDDAYI